MKTKTKQANRCVTDLMDLNHILLDGKRHKFWIMLGGGVARSYKTIQLVPVKKGSKEFKLYKVRNHIDNTRQVLQPNELLDPKLTHFKEALEKHALVWAAEEE